MAFLGALFRGALIFLAGVVMLGTGVCSLVFLPNLVTGGFGSPSGDGVMLILLNLGGWGIAIACFFAIKNLLGYSGKHNSLND